MSESRVTNSGAAPTQDGSVPTTVQRADGQYADHWILSDEERAKGFVRPVRQSYQHVGIPGPRFPLRDPTDEERERNPDCVKFEEYPESERPVVGSVWTQAQLDKIGKGCGTVTHMPQKIAETYARQPTFYGSTFCCGCNQYLRVGAAGEFVWDGTSERVGT